MKKNKFIYKIVFGIMLAIGLFFNSDKVLAKKLNDITEHDYCIYKFVDNSGKTRLLYIFSDRKDGKIGIYNPEELEYNTSILYSDNMQILSNDDYLKRQFWPTAYGQASIDYVPTKEVSGRNYNFDCPLSLQAGYDSVVDKYYLADEDFLGETQRIKIDLFETHILSTQDIVSGEVRECPNSVVEYAKSRIKWAFDHITLEEYNQLLNNLKKDGQSMTSAYQTYEQLCEDFNNRSYKLKEINGSDYDDIINDVVEKNKCKIETITIDTSKGTNEVNEFLIYSDSPLKSTGQKWTELQNELDRKKNEYYNICINRSNLSTTEKNNKVNEAQNDLDKTLEANEETGIEIDTSLTESVEGISSISLGSDIGEATCDSILGQDLIDLISKLYGYIKIAAPILLLVFGTVDFGTAVISQDKDALEKAFKKFIKRAIICMAIFFIPIILNWLLTSVKTIDGTQIFPDPMCGIK